MLEMLRLFDGSVLQALRSDTVNDVSVRRRRILGTMKSPWAKQRRRLSVQRLHSSSIIIVLLQYC